MTDSARERSEAVSHGTDLASRLADLFAKVVGVETVGPDANFFELGGHSLAAIRLVQLARRELDAHFKLEQLFDHPTPEALARCIEAEVIAP